MKNKMIIANNIESRSMWASERQWQKITICWCCLFNVNNVCLHYIVHLSVEHSHYTLAIKWWEICTRSNDLMIIVHATISCLLLFIYLFLQNEHENRTDSIRVDSTWAKMRCTVHTFIIYMYWHNDGGNHVVNLMQINQYHTI